MEKLVSLRRRVTRSVPLSIVAILVGAAIITPSVSGAAAFLTKQKANKLFLGNTTIFSQTQAVPDQKGRQFTVLCPPGTQATGGGANSPAQLTDLSGGTTEAMILVESAPVNAGGRSVGWQVEVIVGADSGSLDVTASAVCAK